MMRHQELSGFVSFASPCRNRLAGVAAAFCALVIGLCGGCSHSGPPENGPTTPATSPGGASPNVDVKAIIDKYASLDNSHDSTIKLKAKVGAAGGPSEQVGLTINRQRQADGTQRYLVEFTSPPDERDRDALIRVSPSGGIEATRYGQATKNFITAKSPTDEESLFGLTLQEMIGGEPENYDYKLVDEETYQDTPAYRVEGTLKPGSESRFPRTVMVISKQNDDAMLIEAYDSHNDLARRLTVDKVGQVSGIWTRLKWTIDNQEQRKKVDFEATDVKYNQNLPDSLFTKDHLKDLVSKH
ncbi:MAG TPA: outer membrane lipoprotein-sorting protein [Blastocatellia bacterium]